MSFVRHLILVLNFEVWEGVVDGLYEVPTILGIAPTSRTRDQTFMCKFYLKKGFVAGGQLGHCPHAPFLQVVSRRCGGWSSGNWSGSGRVRERWFCGGIISISFNVMGHLGSWERGRQTV